MMRKILVMGILTLLLGLTIASSINAGSLSIDENSGFSSDITLKDDAYHHTDEKTWVEWWYFNVIDEKRDLQLFFIYSTGLDPLIGASGVMVGVYNETTSYEIRDIYKKSEFTASYEKPNVSIGKKCHINALDENTFVINGSTKDGKVIWNLTYNRLSKPYNPGGDFGWLCYLPSAKVTGTVTFNETTYRIRGDGYHDHDWSSWSPSISSPYQWRWAEAYDAANNISIVFDMVGNFIFRGELAIITQDKIILFENPQISYSDFTIDFKIFKLFSALFPKTWHIRADNGEYIADFTISINKNLPLYLGGRTRLVNEQVSTFKGVLKKEGNIVYTFNTTGFSEYTKFRIMDLL